MMMDAEIELQMKMAQAIHVLNHDTQSNNRLAANQWLVQFQQTDAAWDVATGILTSNLVPASERFEVEFFAAQILKRKIKNEGRCLRLVAKETLINALLVAAGRFSVGPPQLLTQICIALSAVVLLAIEYEKPIEQFFSSLHKLQNMENGNVAVLEMLTVLPEEIIDAQSTEKSSAESRIQQLIGQTSTVLEFLLLQSKTRLDDENQLYERNKKILRCLLSWVRAGCLSEISPSSLPTHPLLGFVFNMLQVPLTFEMAIEVLVELVSRHEGLPQMFLFRIQYLKDILLTPALTNGDEKVINGLAHFISEIGQAAPELIVEGSAEVLVLIDAILSCIDFPSEAWDIPESTLQFWCTLTSYLLAHKPGMALNGKNVNDIFIPVFTRLLDSLLLCSQIKDPDFSGESGSHDLPDGLVHFRMNLEELLMDICQYLGFSAFLQKLFSGGWVSADAVIPWVEVEARMFAINLVADTVTQDGLPFDLSVVMRMVTILSNIGPDKIKGFLCCVYKSIADVVGSYSKWATSFTNNITPLLLFCASGIMEGISPNACSSTLRKLCEDNPLVISEKDIEILIWIGESLEKVNLPLEEEEEVVNAIMLTLCSVCSKVLKNSTLSRLFSSSHAAIEKIIDVESEHSLRRNPALYGEVLNSAARGLYRMGFAFNHLASHSNYLVDDDTIPALLTVFWPLVERLFKSVHIENSSLSTAACRSLSQAVKSSGQDFLLYLPSVLDCLSTNFLSFQSQEYYIRTAAIVIEEFGHKEQYGALFINTFDRFTSAASVSAISSSYICDQEPDLVEAYISFATTFVQCCLKEVLAASGSLLELSFQKAAICCTAVHRGAALSAMSYMSCFLEVSLRCLLDSVTCNHESSLNTVMIQVLSRSGERLISNIIHALLGLSAMSRVQKSVTILQQLAAICKFCDQTSWKETICWNSLCHWLHSTVHSLPVEYVKQGEAETLVPFWLETLALAASDYLECRSSDSVRNCNWNLQGKGGRTLKRILRDFAEMRRSIPNPT